nr:hypothetical protein [Microbacterium sp. KRD172]
MPEFAFSRLRRHPDVEATNLQAWDATDELLVQRALAVDLPGDEIAVIGDEYGAITLALTDAGRIGIRVHQDLVTGRRALTRNAEEIGLEGFTSHELDETLLSGARLVLLQLPKALAELEEIADAVARWAATDVVLVAGGRVKHMTLAQNEVLGRRFAEVQPQRAERKSRLVVASEPLPAPDEPPYPQRAQHPGFGLTIVAHGGAFAANRIDIGTRVLLGVLEGMLRGGCFGAGREGFDSLRSLYPFRLASLAQRPTMGIPRRPNLRGSLSEPKARRNALSEERSDESKRPPPSSTLAAAQERSPRTTR